MVAAWSGVLTISCKNGTVALPCCLSVRKALSWALQAVDAENKTTHTGCCFKQYQCCILDSSKSV